MSASRKQPKTVKKKSGGGRKSKAESMTGKQAAAVEVRKGGELDLEPVVLDKADVQLHLKSIKAAQEKLATANSLLQSCYKAAKKVNKYLADEIKLAIKLEKANDPVAFRKQLEVRGIVLKEVGFPVQISAFDTLLGDNIDQCYKRGLDDAKAGRSSNNRYPVGSDMNAAYERGFRHGTADTLGVSRDDADAEFDKGGDDDDGDFAEVADGDIGDIPAALDRRTPANAH